MAGPMGPISPVEMPDFNIMGLLLGGRGYASNWFGQRDKLKIAEAMQAREGQQRAQASQSILASPQFDQAMNNPMDQRSQFGLWGQFQGAGVPEQMATLGNNLLQNNVQNIYQRKGMEYADELEKSRIKLTADEQLRVDEVKRTRDVEQKQKLYQDAFGPDPTNPSQSRIVSDQLRTIAAKNAGVDVPEGYVATINPANQQMVFKPEVGSKPYVEAVESIQAHENMAADASQLLGHFTGDTTLSKGEYQAYRQNLKFAMKKAYETGALDEGTIREFDQSVPEYGTFGTDQGANPLAGKASEILKVFVMSQKRAIMQKADATMIDPASIPSRQQASNIPPIPKDAIATREKAKKQLLEDQAGKTGGTRTGAFPPSGGDSIWGPQSAPHSRASGGR